MKTRFIPLALCWLAFNTFAAELPRPLLQAHAHNDYEHARPLLDALSHGFCSVEADVWLVDGRLLVAHDLRDAKPERTLEALYLNPLQARVKQNGGRVFPGGPTLTLLVDVKSEATNSYRTLREVLQRYEGILTRFHPDRTETNAVTVIISGNRARTLMANEPVRLAAYDGRLDDLDSNDSRHLIPLISDNWSLHFKWRARPEEGPLPVDERAKLLQTVQRAHDSGQRLRWWGAPDNVEAWKELSAAGVDLVNTDDLSGLQGFLGRTLKKP
jgi:hypothetical protein